MLVHCGFYATTEAFYVGYGSRYACGDSRFLADAGLSPRVFPDREAQNCGGDLNRIELGLGIVLRTMSRCGVAVGRFVFSR